jgi:hypothetical protein
MIKSQKRTGETIVLRDAKGNPKIILDASVDALPSIVIKGMKRSSITFEIDGSNPRLILSGQDGRHQIVISLANSEALVSLHDHAGFPSVRLQSTAEFGPEITVFKNGVPKWTARRRRKGMRSRNT